MRKVQNLEVHDVVRNYSVDACCIIDTVFSIGVKYISTQRVVEGYCTYCTTRI